MGFVCPRIGSLLSTSDDTVPGMTIRSVGFSVMLSVCLGCAGSSEPAATQEADEAQETEGTEATEPQAEDSEDSEGQPSMPGGWGEGDVNAEGPREAAAFAVQEQSRVSGDTIRLVSIVWVSQQVVSGMNYRLGLNITRNGTAEQATAQVYTQPWTSTTQLTGWSAGLVR